jgi:hypothetical protein
MSREGQKISFSEGGGGIILFSDQNIDQVPTICVSKMKNIGREEDKRTTYLGPWDYVVALTAKNLKVYG